MLYIPYLSPEHIRVDSALYLKSRYFSIPFFNSKEFSESFVLVSLVVQFSRNLAAAFRDSFVSISPLPPFVKYFFKIFRYFSYFF